MNEQSKGNSLGAVRISVNESRESRFSNSSIEVGLNEFHRNGAVVIEDAVDCTILDRLRAQMIDDIPGNLCSPKVHFNHGRAHGNVSQTIPLLPEFLYGEVWANTYAVQLLEYIIGPRPKLAWTTANIALPGGEGRQAVHSDYYCEHHDFPVFIEACIFLDDVSSENGSTELWLGTHIGSNKKDHISKDLGWIKRERFNERAKTHPPFQPCIKKGSILLRDFRLWHAGMPNYTTEPRIMLGFLYCPSWFASPMRLRLPAEARSIVSSWSQVECLATFDEHDFEYLDFRQNLNLTQHADDEEEYSPKHGSIIAGPEHYWTNNEEASQADILSKDSR